MITRLNMEISPQNFDDTQCQSIPNFRVLLKVQNDYKQRIDSLYLLPRLLYHSKKQVVVALVKHNHHSMFEILQFYY